MTDLSNITRVVIVDGYGRRMETVNAEHVFIHVLDKGRTLHIVHNGDTTYSTEGKERWLS